MGLPSARKLVAFRRTEIPNIVAGLREHSDRAAGSGPEKGQYMSRSDEGYPERKFRPSKPRFFSPCRTPGDVLPSELVFEGRDCPEL